MEEVYINFMKNIGKRVFKLQAAALERTGDLIDDEFTHAINLVLQTKGHFIISGIGKSGIVGRKIAATFASTGTPSFFVHPAEAFHGDLGMFTSDDAALLISYSGETEEVIRLIATLKKFSIKIIAFVGNKDSTLGKNADIALDVSVEKEACPNNLAPTASTTSTLVMGDALAVALIEQRGFKAKDFAIYHPGGSLGKRLLTQVKDVMHKDYPIVYSGDNMSDVIINMTNGGLGLVVVLKDDGIEGIITDGDLRRALVKYSNLLELKADDIMTKKPLMIRETVMFCDAEKEMLDSEVTSLIVQNDAGRITGILKLLDANKL